MGLGSSFGITSETNNNIQTDGLVFYVDAAYKSSYPRSGTTWTDLYDNSLSGSLTNSPTFNTEGYFDFDGSNDYIHTNFNIDVGTGDFSTCFWFKADVWADSSNDNLDYMAVLSNGTYNSPQSARWSGYSFARVGSFWGTNVSGHTRGGLNFICRDEDNGAAATNDALSTDTWYHVCGTKTSNTLRLYLNGVVQDTTFDADLTVNQTPNLFIGRMADATYPRYFNGQIPLVQIYNKALTAGQVLQNYNAQKQRFGI